LEWRAVLKSYSANTWLKIDTGLISLESSTRQEAKEEKQEAKKGKQVDTRDPRHTRGALVVLGKGEGLLDVMI
jgi:hypothetical protein